MNPAVQKLLSGVELPEFGPGPRKGVLSEREVDAVIQSALAGREMSPTSRELVRALVLLWHDHLNASHTISQGIENADGSFVHAIMHRREPDFWNSKYWWRRVGSHPAFPGIAARVGALLRERGAGELAKKLLPGGKWDPCAFVDACEAGKQ